jgi:hypothetical protein
MIHPRGGEELEMNGLTNIIYQITLTRRRSRSPAELQKNGLASRKGLGISRREGIL